jgi:hypothetical protein
MAVCKLQLSKVLPLLGRIKYPLAALVEYEYSTEYSYESQTHKSARYVPCNFCLSLHQKDTGTYLTDLWV